MTGVMDFAFGLYRIQPTQGADYVNVNPRTRNLMMSAALEGGLLQCTQLLLHT